MKKLIIFLLVISSFTLFAQEDFKWDLKYDIEGSQYDLFLRLKKYVSFDKQPNYSDEQNFTVVATQKIKAGYSESRSIRDNLNFEYKVILQSKENKIRLIIKDVKCTEKKYNYIPASLNYPADNYGLNIEQFKELMLELRENINKKTLEIKAHLKEPLEVYPQW